MKTMKALITAVSLFGLIEGSAAMAADGVVSKDALGAGSYCHMKFAPLDQKRSTADHPVLKSTNAGDLVDFYGPCDHDPLGKDEVQEQSTHLSWRRDYTD